MSAGRLTSERLPPYSYVPSFFPHPHSDPAGHRFGRFASVATAAHLDRWTTNVPYMLGLDLFNHGYYWEAHEAWEAVWHAAGRHGPIADFVKGLIQLAVAGVKCRQGMPDSASWHAHRGAELLLHARREGGTRLSLGLDVEQVAAWAEQIATSPPSSDSMPPPPVEVLFPFVLWPLDPAEAALA
jgi:predicted metal-dependent hydrolase